MTQKPDWLVVTQAVNGSVSVREVEGNPAATGSPIQAVLELQDLRSLEISMDSGRKVSYFKVKSHEPE